MELNRLLSCPGSWWPGKVREARPVVVGEESFSEPSGRAGSQESGRRFASLGVAKRGPGRG